MNSIVRSPVKRSGAITLVAALALLGWTDAADAAGRPAARLDKTRLGSSPLRIRDGAAVKAFSIALDEVYRTTPAGAPLIEKVSRHADPEAIRATVRALRRSQPDSSIVLYEIGKPRTRPNRRIATRDLVLKLSPSANPHAIAGEIGATYGGPIRYAPGCFRFRTSDPADTLAAAEALAGRDGVLAVWPQLGQLRERRAVPNDPLYPLQWHLSNNATLAGVNVESVWNTYRGAGVQIGVIDDGANRIHPDLVGRIDKTLDHDFRDGDGNASASIGIPDFQDPLNEPGEDSHGTAVASIAAGDGFNGLGVCGVAPAADLVPLRLIGAYTTDLQEADAFNHRNDVIDVKNNSWGPPDNGAIVSGPGDLATLAMENATRSGRGGLGTVFVWAAGNGGLYGDNSNRDGFASSIHGIAVGATNDSGTRSDFSEQGANILVCAPGGGNGGRSITAADLLGNDGYNVAGSTYDLPDANYTETFAGTSAAAPVVSGVIALMLQARSTLTWRDVQEILVRSSHRIDPSNPSWFTNGAGFRFSDEYGAGLVNATAAVNLATTWTNLGPMRSTAKLPTNDLLSGVPIPDNVATGTTLTFPFNGTALRVEHAAVTLFIDHPARGELECTLTSPNGTVSRLAWVQPEDDSAGYFDWTFSSVQFWGENASGNWTLRVADRKSGNTGQITQATLALHGSETGPAVIPETPRNLAAEGLEGGAIRLAWEDVANNESGYEVQYSFGWGDPWQVAATLPANSTSYVHRLLTQDVPFYYRVRATRTEAVSAFSNVDSAYVKDGDAILYFSNFNATSGYIANQALGGQQGWQSYPANSTYPTDGVVADSFSSRGRPGFGQQAYIGKTLAGGGGDFRAVDYFIGHTPAANATIEFTALACIVDSTNGRYDEFGFALYNSDGDWLAEILFDNGNLGLYRATDANPSYAYTGVTFSHDRVYSLQITLDLPNNRWSAKLDTVTLFANETIAGSLPRTLGFIAPFFIAVTSGNPGNNYMLFDEFKIEQKAAALPGPPANFTAFPVSATSIVLEWEDHPLGHSVELQRKPTGNATWQTIATVPEDTHFFTDGRLQPATSYDYRARSLGALGNSSYVSTVASTLTEYAEWRNLHLIAEAAGDLDDGDGDGIPLLLEYAFALNPRRNSSAHAPAAGFDGGNLTVTYHKARSDLTYTAKTSTDLLNWTASGVTETAVGREVTARTPIGAARTKFLRIEVSRPAPP